MHDLSALLASPPAAPKRVRAGALDPPQRFIGGAPVPEMLALWVQEGLPAPCWDCGATFKFTWFSGGGVEGWFCPGYGERCWCWVPYVDVLGSADGDEVAVGYHPEDRRPQRI